MVAASSLLYVPAAIRHGCVVSLPVDRRLVLDLAHLVQIIFTEFVGGRLSDRRRRQLAQQLFELLRNLPPEWVVVILSAAPISEVRGGIPAGMILGMPLATLLPVAIVSNVVAVIPVVLLFNWVADWLIDAPVLGRLIGWLIRRARSREAAVERYGVWAVTLFVAIPLPVTGAWTGSLVAAVFGMPFGRALGCLTIGVIIASAIVTSLSLGGIGAFNAISAAP
jgi:uncharacterized membrane protein